LTLITLSISDSASYAVEQEPMFPAPRDLLIVHSRTQLLTVFVSTLCALSKVYAPFVTSLTVSVHVPRELELDLNEATPVASVREISCTMNGPGAENQRVGDRRSVDVLYRNCSVAGKSASAVSNNFDRNGSAAQRSR